MLLKTFDKYNASVVTEYSVFDSAGEFVDLFTVDYLHNGKNVEKKLLLIEGGVGVNCFLRILEKAGYKIVVRDESAAHSDYYYIEKEKDHAAV